MNPGKISHSNSIGNCFLNTTEYCLSKIQQDCLPFFPSTAPSRKRCRPWQWRIEGARLCNKHVDIHLKSWDSIRLKPVVSAWPLINCFYTPEKLSCSSPRRILYISQIHVMVIPRWIAALRVAFMNFLHMATFTSKYSIESSAGFS